MKIDDNFTCDDFILTQIGRNESLEWSPEFIQANQIVLGVCLFSSFVCLACWFWFKNRFERTQKRPSQPVMLTYIGITIYVIGVNGRVIVPEFPCFIGSVILVNVIPLIAGALIARVVFFFFLFKFAQSKALNAAESTAQTGYAARGMGKLDDNGSMIGFSSTIDDDDEEEDIKEKSSSSSCYLFFLALRTIIINPSTTHHQTDLLVLRFMTTNVGLFYLTLLFLFPFLTYSVLSVVFTPVLYCTNCGATMDYFYTLVALGVICCFVGFVVWWKVRQFQDPWGLRLETFISMLLSFACLVLLFITGYTVRTYDSPAFSSSFLIEVFMVFILAEQTLVQLLLGLKQAAKQQSQQQGQTQERQQHHDDGKDDDKNTLRSQMSMKGSGNLNTIIQDERLSKGFEQFLTSELGIESLFFVRDVETWKKTYFDVSERTRLVRAKKLFDTYIDPAGMFTVNISSDVFDKVKTRLPSFSSTSQIHQHHSVSSSSSRRTIPVVDRDAFDPAYDEICELLERGSIRRFIRSEQFLNTESKYSSYNSSNALDDAAGEFSGGSPTAATTRKSKSNRELQQQASPPAKKKSSKNSLVVLPSASTSFDSIQ